MIHYLYVLLATLLLAVEFAFSKKYQALAGVSLRAGLRFNAVSGFISAGIMAVLLGFQLEWSAHSLALALAMSLCGLGYSLLSFRVMKLGGMALYTTFLMSGGMLLPYVFGVLFWGEPLTLVRLAAVILILVAVILTNLTRSEPSGKLLLLCGCVFVLNGLVSILSKGHQITLTRPTVSSFSFVMYSSLCKGVLSTLALLLHKPQASQPAGKMPVGLVAGAAVIGAASYLLQLIGAKALPASVLYPMITGGSILFSGIVARWIFKETLTRLQMISLAACFIGTLMFL